MEGYELKHRSKDGDGRTVWTASEHRVTPMFKEQSDGSVVFTILGNSNRLRFRRDCAIPIPSLDKVPETINTIIQFVKEGGLDATMKAASDASPLKGKQKKK
jgi:hypothetical protein